MKILLINWQDRLNPQAGGAETHLHEIFGRLVRGGHEVTLLASGWEGAPPREQLDGMEVHRAGGRHTFSVAAPLYYRSRLADQSFDVVVEALNKVPLFSPLWAPKPAVLIVHHLFGSTAFREATFPVAALTWLLERPIPAVYRSIPTQAISRSTAEDLEKRGLAPERIRVIYPGVDLDFFIPAASDRAAEPTFLYLGRLKRYKGVDVVIEAVARLKQRGLGVKLIVAGKGEWAARLKARAADLGVGDRVEFPGFVSDDRKRELFRLAWANLFPSPKEGWGITNLEAGACGTPSIASDAPGLRESVMDGHTGRLVAHGDADAWASAIGELAANRETVESMGVAAREFARQFTWDRAADETANHLQEVVAGRRLPGLNTASS